MGGRTTRGTTSGQPAHYIACRVGASEALPVGVQQMSNSGAAALGTAAEKLIADPGAEAALITTADRFALPGFDRWSADYGVAYGDAGTAALLRRRGPEELPGTLLLRSLAFVTDASFEEMYRGRDSFSAAPLAHGGRVDVKRPKKAYLEMRGGIEEFRRAAVRCVDRVLRTALSDAGLEADDPRIVLVALPRLGDSVLDLMYRPVLDGAVRAEVLSVRESSGHLGAGDLLGQRRAHRPVRRSEVRRHRPGARRRRRFHLVVRRPGSPVTAGRFRPAHLRHQVISLPGGRVRPGPG